MGREVRRVPADWQHPKDEQGRYIPLLGRSFSKDTAEWNEGKELWEQGKRRHFCDGTIVPRSPEHTGTWEEWEGPAPQAERYMPDWPEERRTHWQMYEDTSEGTPISPVFATPEELARWLADNRASAFANMTATYEQWLATRLRGWAPSAVIAGGVMRSGVAASEK